MIKRCVRLEWLCMLVALAIGSSSVWAQEQERCVAPFRWQRGQYGVPAIQMDVASHAADLGMATRRFLTGRLDRATGLGV